MCRCRKNARCVPCIERETPEIFDGGNFTPKPLTYWGEKARLESLTLSERVKEVVGVDLCVCGPVTRAQGVCECGA